MKQWYALYVFPYPYHRHHHQTSKSWPIYNHRLPFHDGCYTVQCMVVERMFDWLSFVLRSRAIKYGDAVLPEKGPQ